MSTQAEDKVEFLELNADNLDKDKPLQLESLCMNCKENGTTSILFTKIPHFKEIVVMAFACEHCGHRSSDLQSTGAVQAKGCHMELKVPAGSRESLNRQVVKADSATITLPELEFEIPAGSQKSRLTTLEGLLSQASQDLGQLQEERRRAAPDVAASIDSFLAQLDKCASGQMEFTIIIDDPAGNSFIEPLGDGFHADTHLVRGEYERSRQQVEALGLVVAEAAGPGQGDPSTSDPAPDGSELQGSHHGSGARGTTQLKRGVYTLAGDSSAFMDKYSAPDEVMFLPGKCGACGADSETRMFQTHIPYFKEVIIMATSCDVCGYKSQDVKVSGAIPPKGKQLTVSVLTPEDLKRDIIKSDSTMVKVPEIELELASGTLGSLITTTEGLMQQIQANLKSTASFNLGDSAQGVKKNQWKTFLQKVQDCIDLKIQWTLILRDPLGSSFIGSLADNPGDDEKLVTEEFERTEEEDDEYCITQLKELEVKEQQEAAGKN